MCSRSRLLFAILGLPPVQSIQTPPFDGELCISPYWPFFLIRSWPFDEFTFDADIPDDPALAGLEVLFQALVGPEFGGPDKDAAWTNCGRLVIE